MNPLVISLVNKVADHAKTLGPRDRRELAKAIVRRLGVAMVIDETVSAARPASKTTAPKATALSKWERIVRNAEAARVSPESRAAADQFRQDVRDIHGNVLDG